MAKWQNGNLSRMHGGREVARGAHRDPVLELQASQVIARERRQRADVPLRRDVNDNRSPKKKMRLDVH